MTGKLRDLTVNRDGTQNIVVTVPDDFTKTFDALKNFPVSVEIKKAAKGRSRDANAFCWALCSDIGKAMTPPLSKEEVYRKAIKAVGVYFQTTVCVWDIDKVRRRWTGNGAGWLFEIIDNAAETGKKLVHMYFGTSVYSVDEMRNVLDWLIDEAQQMEIPIPLSKKDEEELLERWGKK